MKLTSSNHFRARSFLAAFIGVLGILGAPREKAWAREVASLETISGTDFVAAAVGGLRDTRLAAMEVRGIRGTVNKAYLYWHGPMNSTNRRANAVIRLNGKPVTGVHLGFSSDNHWGFRNSQAYRADVTSLVRARRNGTYLLSHYVKHGTNINANGASLLVFFDDGNPANDRDIVVFDGNDSNADNPHDAPGWSAGLGDLHPAAGRGFLQLHVADGQFYQDAPLLLNGEVIESRGEVFQGLTVPAANNGPANYGRLWDVISYDLTEWLADGTNSLALTHGYLGSERRRKGDCVSLVAAVLNLPKGAMPASRPPVIAGTPAITVNSPDALAVQASETDDDGDPLTCTIAIDGTPVAISHLPGGTAPTTARIGVTNSFALGKHTVTFAATDGRSRVEFITVINVIDETPPVLHLPANIIVPSSLGMTSAVVRYEVTATDNFPGVVVIAQPPSGSVFPIGTTVVTGTAVDAAGRVTKASFTVTVTDGLPPTIERPKDLLRSTDPGASNAVVSFTVNARDNLPGVTVACAPSSGSAFQVGITTVVCSARDAAGNTATTLFTVTVVDRESPALTLPADLTVTTHTGQTSAVINYAATVTDNLPGATVLCTPPPGSAFPVGTTRVTCVATDAGNNQTTGSFTVTVLHRDAPVAAPGD
jgi:hypothetical protein